MLTPNAYPDLDALRRQQLAVFPEHEAYLAKRFDNCDEAELKLADQVAGWIRRVAGGDLATVCDDYRWLSGVVLEEELFFRRNGRYRLSAFADALEQVYNNREFMTKYMNGLLASQVWWKNHTAVLGYFRDAFVAENPVGHSHLEVGPGHGLLLAMAAGAGRAGRIEGWDISEASIANTRAALQAIGAPVDRIALRLEDLFSAPDDQFDAVVFSEVLEHLEEPKAALRALHALLAPGGRIFINAPVNSPAPDHLYLFRTPEEVADMVSEAGFEIESTLFAPCTGATLERARKLNLTVSAAVIARRRT